MPPVLQGTSLDVGLLLGSLSRTSCWLTTMPLSGSTVTVCTVSSNPLECEEPPDATPESSCKITEKHEQSNHFNTALHTLHSATYTSQRYIHSIALHTLHCATYTPQHYIHFTALHTLHCATYTPLRYIHSTALHTLHSTTYTPQRYIHSTALHTLHSTTYTPQRYIHSTALHTHLYTVYIVCTHCIGNDH